MRREYITLNLPQLRMIRGNGADNDQDNERESQALVGGHDFPFHREAEQNFSPLSQDRDDVRNSGGELLFPGVVENGLSASAGI